MALTFRWNQRTGATGTTVTGDLGISGNLFNFQNQDVASAAQYTAYPITAGNNSYEVFMRGHFYGSFNKVQNVQFWKSAGNLGTGETLYWKDGGVVAYTQPLTTAVLTNVAVPTADPGSSNVSIGGSQASSLSAAGFSDYIVLQLRTTTASEAGDTETFTFTLQYDEN
jgi:hypothetical protein